MWWVLMPARVELRPAPLAGWWRGRRSPFRLVPRPGTSLGLPDILAFVEVLLVGQHDAHEDEVGDVLIALAELCDRFDISLEGAAVRAAAKLESKAPGWREELGDRLRLLRRRMDGEAAD